MKTARLLMLAALLCSACTSRAEPPAAFARSQQIQGAAMQLTINHRSFTADLADTAAVQELSCLLPLTLTLQDHLGNENTRRCRKACCATTTAPAASKRAT